MKKLLLIVNPVAGKGKGKAKLFEAIDTFTQNGFRVTVLPTEANGTEEIIIEEAGKYDLLVAIGGDGTLNAVAGGIIKSGADVPMGYIPLGSTNDFGYSLGIPKSIPEACRRIANGRPRFIDIGRLDDKYFVYIACAGLFAGVSYMTSQQLKHALGHGAYFVKGLLELADLQVNTYKVELDDEIIEGDYLYVGVSNSLRAGGIFTLPKEAVDFDDGLFELTLIKNPTNLGDRIKLVNDIFSSNINGKQFIHKKIGKAVISCDSVKGWSVDGENGGEKNEVSFEVLKKRLKLIY